MRSEWIIATMAATAVLASGGWAHAASPTAAQVRAADAGARLFRQKRYSEAIAELDKVLTADSTNAVALTMRGFVKEDLGEYALALGDFDAAWKLVPESPNAWSNACWGRALANVDLDLGLKLCDGAIKADPANNKDYDTRAFLHLRRSEFDAAVSDYTLAIHEYRTASSLFGRAVAKSRLGQADAQADRDAALKLDPAIAETYAKRGVSF